MRWSALFMVCAGLSACCGALGLGLAVVAWQRARLPYNEQGQYFDGLVNYDEQAVLVYAAAALLVWVLALFLAQVARRARQA